MKNGKLKINDILIEKNKDMLENLDFEQDYYSRTAKVLYKTGHDSIRLTKCLNNYNRSYHDNLNYFDLLGFICKYLLLNEISWW